METAISPIVSTDWLAERLGDPQIQIVDASWYLPTQNRNAEAEYRTAHIPGAIFFDIDALSDRSNPLPHMLLDAPAFGQAASALGLRSDATIVVYDGAGLFSAPRVWWTLRHFGARDVRVLAGGFPKWQAEGRTVEGGARPASPGTFHAVAPNNDVADLAQVTRSLQDGSAQVVDARPAARFRGDVPEPRPGLASGHMPGSRNLPFSDVVADGQLKDVEALRALFSDAGVALDRPLIASCGSGVSAAVVLLALETLGKRDVRLYDGSWADYGSRPELPVATGGA